MIRELTDTEKSVVTLWLGTKGLLTKGALFAQDSIIFVDRKIALVRLWHADGRSSFRLTGMPKEVSRDRFDDSIWKITFETTFVNGRRTFTEAHIFDFDLGTTDTAFCRDVMLWMMLNPG
jgi:hypothetical protein